MIVYVTRWLGGYQGAGKSAWDALSGVIATGRKVHVIAGHRVELPDEIAGQSTHDVQVQVSGGRLAAARRAIVNKSRGLLKPLLREPAIANVLHGLNDRLQTTDRQRAAGTRFSQTPSLVVVNSLGSHGDFLALELHEEIPSVLIVRESPGHYQHDASDDAFALAVKSMASYDALIFVSSRCRDAWLQEPALKDMRSFYIPNCCEEEDVLKLRATDRDASKGGHHFSPDRFHAVSVASLQQRKGQDLIVEELPRIIERIPNFELHLVGSDSRGFGKQLRTAARAAKVADRIRFHGASDTALSILHAADALLLPTRAEAMPRVVLEAMALGTPVIASDVDGIPELVEHDRGGWLFSIERPEAMVAGLSIVAHDQRRAVDWVNESKQRYWQDFSQNLLTRRYAEVLNSLTSTIRNVPRAATKRPQAA